MKSPLLWFSLVSGSVALAPRAEAQVPVPVPGEAPPPPPASPPPPILTDLADPPLVGELDGLVFVRDRRDLIRLYPHAELVLEAHGFFGSRVTDLRAEDAGVDLGPRFFVRRSRFELGGELGKRLAFNAALELRANPAIDGARSDGRDTAVALDDAWGYVNAGRGLGLMFGFFQAPFSLENRTRTRDLAFMERSVAVRGFAAPAPKVLGAAFGGRTYTSIGLLNWTAGAFGAEALTPGEPDRAFDGIGRIGLQPLATHLERGDLRSLRFGISARAGTRNPRDAESDAPAITTRQGFALWRPTRIDGTGNAISVVQTGTQYALGVEARIPTPYITVRAEAFYASKDTRETPGSSSLATERGGRLRGVAGYVELSMWPLMALGVLTTEQIELDDYPEAEHLELASTLPYRDRYGVELAVRGGGIRAEYEPAARSSTADASAPGGNLRVIELGAALNYWHTERFKLGVDYDVYVTPDSGSRHNLAGVPGNLPANGSQASDLSARHLHELAARATLSF